MIRERIQRARQPRGGFTLIEALTALTVISVLLAMSVPSVIRTMEQAHADTAGANLNAIWNAQRFYWLDNRTFAPDLATLEAANLLDVIIVTGNSRYTYAIDTSTASTFRATASRTGSTVWTGQFTIDEAGDITGTVENPGVSYAITPGFD